MKKQSCILCKSSLSSLLAFFPLRFLLFAVAVGDRFFLFRGKNTILILRVKNVWVGNERGGAVLHMLGEGEAVCGQLREGRDEGEIWGERARL